MRSLERPLRTAVWTLALTLTGCGTGCGASQASPGAPSAPAPSGAAEATPHDAAQRLAVAEQASAAAHDGGADLHTPLAPMPIISFGAPAYASSGDANQ